MSAILCVDDEPVVGVTVEEVLRSIGHRPTFASSVGEALSLVEREPFDLILSDFHVPDAGGIELIDRLRQQGQEIPVIIMTAYSSVEDAVLAMKRGAADYLTKPLRVESLRLAVNNALAVARLRRENEDFRQELSELRGARAIVGQSAGLQQVMETVRTVAPARATVLLTGESGTGKELCARALHELSPRAPGPFIAVNCAALPEGLVESTLFGHERGAFTGAAARAQGAFERAHNGTLLLDEISEMRLDLQAKLLRAVQEREFERVGGTQPVKVDVRIVSTTNRDLGAEIEAGRFRRDLFYRLSVVPIHLPPLRERLDDIPVLVEHFVKLFSAQSGIRAPMVTREAMASLKARRWPGNVRELANAVERAVILGRSGRLGPEAFGPDLLAPGPAAEGPRRDGTAEGEAACLPHGLLNLRKIESWAIRRALATTGGHRARAAELLGISERTLRNKLNPAGAGAAAVAAGADE